MVTVEWLMTRYPAKPFGEIILPTRAAGVGHHFRQQRNRAIQHHARLMLPGSTKWPSAPRPLDPGG
jgi:hypothetical protein